jgi:hypothetical protein
MGIHKFQNVKFRDVQECLDYLPEDELRITLFLRNLVFECIPDVTEKLSYNVPYYMRKKAICFIWPASILWGKKPSYEGVRFGFTSGYLLNDEIGYLEKGGRKQIFWRDFKSIAEIDVDLLRAYIYEALMVDDLKKTKKI